VAGWWADARVAAVAEALAPFGWRDFTDRMLARRAVGAVDRYIGLRFVSTIPGAKAGGVGPVEQADPATHASTSWCARWRRGSGAPSPSTACART
jgi:hypothetical protein